MTRSEAATPTTAATRRASELQALEEREVELDDEVEGSAEDLSDNAAWYGTADMFPEDDYLTVLKKITIESAQQQLFVPNYPEDEAVRHAALAPIGSWRLDGNPLCYLYRHRTLDVQLRSDHAALPFEEAQEAHTHRSERTLVTLRIALGLWNLWREDRRRCLNGEVAIRAEELLHWLGIAKHTKAAGQSRRTDGWRSEEYAMLAWDLWFAESLWVTGTRVITSRGKQHTVEVNDRYVRVSFVHSVGTRRRLVGLLLSPGRWINDYHDRAVYFLTPLTRRIFALHPHNDQHALRLALYLAERWRERAFKRAYDTPIGMEQLLHQSAIAIPERNRQRFAACIEQALTMLQHHNIIGSCAHVRQVATEPGETRFNFNAWLASEWRIAPPEDILAALNQAVASHRQTPSLRRAAKKPVAA